MSAGGGFVELIGLGSEGALVWLLAGALVLLGGATLYSLRRTSGRD